MIGSHDCIKLTEVDWDDDTFAIHSHLSGELLESSLQRFGLLNPPWVWMGQRGTYAIIDGFKRLHWMRDRGASEVVCLVFPGTVDVGRLWMRRIEEKLFGPPLNVAEKAQIIARLAGLGIGERDLFSALRILHVAPRQEVIAQWLRLADSDRRLLEAVAAEQVCERAALDLADWEQSSQEQSLILLQELRCSASIQMQILEQISEIAFSRDRSRSDVLADPKLENIRRHPDWNHRQKTQAVRELLYRWRFPRLRMREQQFAHDLQSALLPTGVRLIHPPAFEGLQWQLQIAFSQPEELAGLLQSAQEFARSKYLPKLLYGSGRKAEINT